MPLLPHPLARPASAKAGTPPSHPRWITRDQAAAILGVSTRQVRRLEVEGKIRISRPSPQVVRIDRQSIDAMLERHVEEYPATAAIPPHELAG